MIKDKHMQGLKDNDTQRKCKLGSSCVIVWCSVKDRECDGWDDYEDNGKVIVWEGSGRYKSFNLNFRFRGWNLRRSDMRFTPYRKSLWRIIQCNP